MDMIINTVSILMGSRVAEYDSYTIHHGIQIFCIIPTLWQQFTSIVCQVFVKFLLVGVQPFQIITENVNETVANVVVWLWTVKDATKFIFVINFLFLGM